ncbi:MAG: CvpA family protein [Acidobacteriaceae bacterium]|nr:CvpA family protein [Acidobacteriaceae bacterium]
MNGTDWIIMVVLFLSVIQAASAGFFQEAFGIAGLVFGYLLAAWNYQRLANHFASYGAPWLLDIAAFLVIFALVMLLAGLAGRVARWVMREAGLNFIDRTLGAALGLLRGALIVAVVLVSMAAFTPTSAWLRGSQLAPYFLVAGRAAIWVAPSELRARFYQGLDLLHRKVQ